MFIDARIVEPVTEMFNVASANKPSGSVTRTPKTFGPALAGAGVPDKVPSVATLSQDGPLVLEKLSTSPLGSLALVESEPEYGTPGVAAGKFKGLLVNEGAPLTLMNKLAVFDAPNASRALTTKELNPRSELAGVPERKPAAATLSQAGPLTLAKVIASPLGSLASAVIVSSMACPMFTSGKKKELLV